jgi:hypothetical protein
MTPARQRPPLVADERIQLVGWLDLQRAIRHAGHLDPIRELLDGRTGHY